MHIELVTLHNFGLFQHLEQSFDRGLVGILGPNGTGKTTLVNGVYAALTNDFSRFFGVKTDQIHDMAGDKEESYVEVAAEHDGRKFWIRRSLRPNKSELKIAGEKSITKAPEIEARLQQDLGVDTRLIGPYVFVDQWRMFDFLELTPAKRAEAFRRLCRTEKSETIFAACQKMLGDTDLSATTVDNSDELVTQIGECDHQIEQLEVQRGVHEGNLLTGKSLESAQKILRKRERHETLTTELDEAEEDEPRLREIVAKRKKAAAQAAKEVKAAEEQVALLKAPAQAARVSLKEWDAYEKRRKRKDKLNNDAVGIVEESLNNPEPKKPQHLDSLAEFRSTLSAHNAAVAIAKEVIEAYEETGTGVCPTCHQKIDEEFVATARVTVDQRGALAKKFQAKVDACEAYIKAKSKWDNWRSGWEARKKAVEEELAGFEALAEPEGSKEELEAAIAALESAESELEDAVETKNDAETSLSTAEAKLTALEDRIKRLSEKISDTVVAEKLFQKVKRRMGEHEAASLAIATIDGQLTEIGKKRDEARKSLEALKAVMKRQKKLRKAAKLLERARDVFHWSALPWQVAQGNLMRMEADINDALGWFGNPFWVAADESLGFTVHIPGRTEKRAEALSGGQKVILAVAFRSGANAVFNTDLGMMFLDEPTSGLDADNLGYFEEALQSLAAQVRGKRQLIIVTHAANLRSGFDQVIDLAEIKK